MSEKEEARVLANRILDRINGDPDDDLAILSRQLLRADEELEELKAAASSKDYSGRLECAINGIDYDTREPL